MASEAPATIPEVQLTCLRELRFLWQPNIESGGPMVDYEAPFGTPKALDDLAALAQEAAAAGQLPELYFAVMAALPKFTATARLAPGVYHLPADMLDRLKQDMANEDAGPADDGSFEFTEEHGRLIANMRWGAIDAESIVEELTPSDDPSVGEGIWQSPCIWFKRPFGDLTYFQLEMAQHLGLAPESGEGELSQELENRMNFLYDQLHIALQVFVRHAAV